MTSFTSSKIVLIIIYLYKGRFILSERILQKKTEILDSKLPLTNHCFPYCRASHIAAF